MQAIFENITYNQQCYTNNTLPLADYENCNFINCDFSNAVLSNIRFIDCTFNTCNLSLAIITNISFQNTQFKNCKMLGLHFESCNQFALSFNFNNCQLNHATFYKLKIPKTVFNNCNLEDADFSQTNLQQSFFDFCNLNNTIFDQTNLEKTDFRKAINYTINPTINNIKKAKFSVQGITGLLQHLNIDITP